MPTEWVSPEEAARRRISVTIWATERVLQRGTASFLSSFLALFSAGFCAAVKSRSLSDSYLSMCLKKKSLLCVILIVMQVRKKQKKITLWRVSLLFLSLISVSLTYWGRKWKDAVHNLKKYPRTVKMPKDSGTHCLLDNSLQATISHKSVSASPSLLNPSLSLSLSLSGLPSSRGSSRSSSPDSSGVTGVTSCSLSAEPGIQA